MTSFTKALYRRDPAAAEAFHEHQKFEHRATYGKTPPLACFTPAFHALKPVFGKRAVPPAQVSDCPNSQSFCIDNGLMAHNCSACKNKA